MLRILRTLDCIRHIRLSFDRLPDLRCVQLHPFCPYNLLSGTLSNVMFHHVSIHFRNYVLRVLRTLDCICHIRLSSGTLPDLRCVRLHLFFLYIPLSVTLSNAMSHHVSIHFRNYVLRILRTLGCILHTRLSAGRLPALHCV